MLRFRDVLITGMALTGANFVYQAASTELWGVAAERSYFQVGALIILFLGNHLELVWRR